jgi:hypothetical protein
MQWELRWDNQIVVGKVAVLDTRDYTEYHI